MSSFQTVSPLQTQKQAQHFSKPTLNLTSVIAFLNCLMRGHRGQCKWKGSKIWPSHDIWLDELKVAKPRGYLCGWASWIKRVKKISYIKKQPGRDSDDVERQSSCKSLCCAFQLNRAGSMSFLPALKEEAEESSLKSEVRKMIFSFKFVRSVISKRSMRRS